MARDLAVRSAPVTPSFTRDDGTVLLATFDVPFDAQASTFAVGAAADSGRTLIVANLAELSLSPLGARLDAEMSTYPPELSASLLRPVEMAIALGVAVERLRVRSFHRVEALVEVAAERHVRLLVLGPERTRVSRYLYNKAADAVRERLDCLVWMSWDLPRN